MAALKVYVLFVLLALSAVAQNDKKKKVTGAGAAAKPSGGTQTRGHFGNFNTNAGFSGGYRPGTVGHGVHGTHPGVFRPAVNTGGYRPGVGNVGLHGVSGVHGVGTHGVGTHGVGGLHGVGVGGIPGVGVGGLHGVGVGGVPGVGGVHGVGVGVGGIPGVGGVHGVGVGGVHGVGIGGGLGSKPAQATCRYWCKTPEGQAYCCENVNQAEKHPISTQVVKQGNCPPVRPKCPLRNFGGPPVTCSNDGGCAGIDKCCFDRCLSEHVCKPPSGYGK